MRDERTHLLDFFANNCGVSCLQADPSFRQTAFMSLLRVAHVVLFFAQTQVLSGQIWGVFMKEWVGVPRLAMKVNVLSICLLVTAVIVIAIAGAVL